MGLVHEETGQSLGAGGEVNRRLREIPTEHLHRVASRLLILVMQNKAPKAFPCQGINPQTKALPAVGTQRAQQRRPRSANRAVGAGRRGTNAPRSRHGALRESALGNGIVPDRPVRPGRSAGRRSHRRAGLRESRTRATAGRSRGTGAHPHRRPAGR